MNSTKRNGIQNVIRPSAPPLLAVLSVLLLLAAALATPPRLQAQAAPALRGGSHSLWAGGEYSNFSPDFGPSQRLSGLGVFVDLNWDRRWAIEGEARWLHFGGFQGETESNYYAGPKVTLIRHGRLRPYGKILFGAGDIHFPYNIGTGSYFAYVPGGGVDYHLTRHLALRGEYEYQIWPSAPGIPGEPDNGLKPNGFNVGASYHIF